MKTNNLDKNLIRNYWKSKSQQTSNRWTSKEMLEWEIKKLKSFAVDSDVALDLGSGSGDLIRNLQSYKKEMKIIAVDYEKDFSKFFSTEKKQYFYSAEIQDFYTNEVIDLTLLFGVVTYINIDEEIQTYKNIRGFLRESGIFIVKNQCSLKSQIIINKYSEKLKSNYSARYPNKENQAEILGEIFKNVQVIKYPEKFNSHSDTNHFMFVCAP